MTRLISTIGLHGAASTWAYNVVRELMTAAFGEAQVRATYADDLRHLSEDERALSPENLIIKSHHGSAAIDKWLNENKFLHIFSLRDPRDAAISTAQRFQRPLQQTVQWLQNDCARSIRLFTHDAIILRYEERPFDRSSEVRLLADKLEITLDDAAVNEIFQRYRPESVREFAQRLSDLPEGRLTEVAAFKMDQVTKILDVHIGDTRSGKWRDLPPPGPAELTKAFAPYLEPLGYAV